MTCVDLYVRANMCSIINYLDILLHCPYKVLATQSKGLPTMVQDLLAIVFPFNSLVMLYYLSTILTNGSCIFYENYFIVTSPQ